MEVDFLIVLDTKSLRSECQWPASWSSGEGALLGLQRAVRLPPTPSTPSAGDQTQGLENGQHLQPQRPTFLPCPYMGFPLDHTFRIEFSDVCIWGTNPTLSSTLPSWTHLNLITPIDPYLHLPLRVGLQHMNRGTQAFGPQQGWKVITGVSYSDTLQNVYIFRESMLK